MWQFRSSDFEQADRSKLHETELREAGLREGGFLADGVARVCHPVLLFMAVCHVLGGFRVGYLLGVLTACLVVLGCSWFVGLGVL